MTLSIDNDSALYIFSFLTPSDVIQFGLTCKCNMNFIQDRPLWGKFAEKHLEYNNIEFVQNKGKNH